MPVTNEKRLKSSDPGCKRNDFDVARNGRRRKARAKRYYDRLPAG